MRGNVDGDNQSLRGFLRMVETEYPDELLRIRQPVDLAVRITALVFELERTGKSPVVVFENVRGNGMRWSPTSPATASCWPPASASSPKICRRPFASAARNTFRARSSNEAPWEDVVIEGDDVDLTKLPIPLQFTVDAAPYITAGQIVGARSRHRRRHHRLPPADAQGQEPARRVAAFAPPHVRIPPPRRGTGQSLPAAITIGIHPLHYMGSMVYAYPPHVRKFEIIGGLFGEPYRLARCGVDDLEVPAGAEIIIEGEILAERARAGRPVQRVHRLCLLPQHAERVRRPPHAHAPRRHVHSVTSGMSRDHILVSCITREGEILNALRRNLPNVRAVHVPHTTCGAFMAFISMKKIADGEPQMAIMATLGTELYTKYVIVVDDDVDIFNINDVMWAVATRVRAEKDIIFIPGAKGAILDPTSDPENFTVTKMGIDATRPAGRDFAERLTISDDQRARARSIWRRQA